MISNIIKYTKEAFVIRWITLKIRDYGSVSELEIDTKNKLISILFLLNGEKETFKIIIDNYKILKLNDDTYFYVESLKTEREWLDLFISRHIETILPGKKIKFPNKIVKNIVKFLL